MLLGAAIAAGDEGLLRHAFRDRLHERYRAGGAPLLEHARRLAPDALGVTLSGSGPTVIVWADRADRERIAADLTTAFAGEASVRPIEVANDGAG
jgi:homoserine kinase